MRASDHDILYTIRRRDIGPAIMATAMKGTTLLFALVVIVAVVPSAAADLPSSTAAAATFGRVLHQRYGDVEGFWTCPNAQPVGSGRIECLGEVRAGTMWYQTSALAGLHNGSVVISQVRDIAWVRRWSPFSRHPSTGPGVAILT